MQMAIKLGGCTGDEADLLRRAMGSKRGIERIESLRLKLYEGMAGHGITGEEADAIYLKIQSFANFGFAESHALSFALLVYASSWLKLHYPAAFLAALLRNQPMGFYSPQSLVTDARHHGVTILRPDIMHSQAQADLEVPTRSSWGDRSMPRRRGSTAAWPASSRRSRGSSAAPPTRPPSTVATGASPYAWGSTRCRVSASRSPGASWPSVTGSRSRTWPTCHAGPG